MLYLQIFNKGFYQYSKKWAIKKAGDMKGKPKIIKAAFFSAALGSYVYFLFMSDRINAAVSFATNARNDLLCCRGRFFWYFLFLYIRTS